MFQTNLWHVWYHSLAFHTLMNIRTIISSFEILRDRYNGDKISKAGFKLIHGMWGIKMLLLFQDMPNMTFISNSCQRVEGHCIKGNLNVVQKPKYDIFSMVSQKLSKGSQKVDGHWLISDCFATLLCVSLPGLLFRVLKTYTYLYILCACGQFANPAICFNFSLLEKKKEKLSKDHVL